MSMGPMGEGVINTIAMLCAMASTSGSELVAFTVVGDELEIRCEKGDSIYNIIVSVHHLHKENILDVLANVTTLATMTHKSAYYQINMSTRH